jgi:hypothetical protein
VRSNCCPVQLERKSSGSGLEIREYGRRGSVTLTTWHPLSSNVFALTSSTSCGRSDGILRSRTQATEFSDEASESGRVWLQAGRGGRPWHSPVAVSHPGGTDFMYTEPLRSGGCCNTVLIRTSREHSVSGNVRGPTEQVSSPPLEDSNSPVIRNAVFPNDRLCGWLQIQGSGFDSRRYHIF